MAEYIDRNLIEWYGCDFEDGSCEHRECSECSQAECSHTQVMQIPTVNAILIPEGATNGDMIEAMFPDIKIHEHEKTNICDAYIQIDIWDFSIYVSKDWWDEPYKKEVEE